LVTGKKAFLPKIHMSQEDNMKKAAAQIIMIGITVMTFTTSVLAGCGGGP
jgi:hypothetical protein